MTHIILPPRGDGVGGADHSELGALTADDHNSGANAYHTDVRGDARYEPRAALTAYVSPTGPADHSTIQAANDALAPLVSLSIAKYAVIEVGPGTYTEDVILSEGVHLVGVESEAVWIIGAGTASGYLVTMSGNSSIQNVTISPADAVTYTAGIRIITSSAPPLGLEPRHSRNINFYSGFLGTLSESIRHEAVATGIPLITFDGVTDVGPVTSLNTLAASTAKLAIRDSKLNGAILLDGSGVFTLVGTDHTPVMSVTVNAEKVFRPIGSSYGAVGGSATNPFEDGDKLAPVNQFVFRPGGSGFGGDTQMNAIVQGLSFRDKYPMPFFPGVPEVGEFIAGDASDGYDTKSHITSSGSVYLTADVECRTAPVGADLIIKVVDLTGGGLHRKLTIPDGTSFAKGLSIIRYSGAPDPFALPAEFSLQTDQQGSSIKAGDIAVSFNAS